VAVKEKHIDDDPLSRLLDRAVQAQTRLLLSYIENSREQARIDMARMIRDEFGGDQVYFGKGVAEKNHARDMAIWSDARPVSEGGQGLSLRALGKKYHLGKSRIAEVLTTIDAEMKKGE
jgi:Mor family transcriptional regulator